jgi:hypothetical protein
MGILNMQNCLSLNYGADSLTRNVGKQLSISAAFPLSDERMSYKGSAFTCLILRFIGMNINSLT